MMIIDRFKTKDAIGEAFPFEISEYFPEFEFNGTRYSFAKPVTVKGIYMAEEDEVTVSADIEAVLSSPCDRCLTETEFNVSVSMTEIFSQIVKDEVYDYSGYDMVLDRAVLDNIILNMPMHVLCKTDCKGLCPHCGVDSNLETCDCGIEMKKANSPFGELNGLFSD